jgi:hypothetical protein
MKVTSNIVAPLTVDRLARLIVDPTSNDDAIILNDYVRRRTLRWALRRVATNPWYQRKQIIHDLTEGSGGLFFQKFIQDLRHNERFVQLVKQDLEQGTTSSIAYLNVVITHQVADELKALNGLSKKTSMPEDFNPTSPAVEQFPSFEDEEGFAPFSPADLQRIARIPPKPAVAVLTLRGWVHKLTPAQWHELQGKACVNCFGFPYLPKTLGVRELLASDLSVQRNTIDQWHRRYDSRLDDFDFARLQAA